MTLEELKASVSPADMETIKNAVNAKEAITDENYETLHKYIDASAETLGEDQIKEPLRYLATTTNGLRPEDLQAVIAEGFDPKVFEQWNGLLGFPIAQSQPLGNTRIYSLPRYILERLQNAMGEAALQSCCSDLGFYLLEKCKQGDPIRDMQTLRFLLCCGESSAAALYVSQADAMALQVAVGTLSNCLAEGPDNVRQTICDMALAQGENIDTTKILLLLLNDCLNLMRQPECRKKSAQKLTAVVETLIAGGRQDITVLLGIGRLRIAQSERLLNHEQEAQQAFASALNYLMPPLENADPLTINSMQIREYWTCLKICQEMAQPKAIALLFEAIRKVEQAQTQDVNRNTAERCQRAEDILGQSIDMSKLYYTMPKALREQFVDYTEPTLKLLNAYLENAEKHKASDMNTEGYNMNDLIRLAGYYQSVGELSENIGRHDESYDALIEAQTLQMRIVGHLQHADGEHMSPQQLLQRLALSVTNHLLAGHYQRQGKRHDLEVVLTANMNLALDCFKSYSRDTRVLHFVINAALELGGLQHRSGGVLAECGTYEKVIGQFHVLNNMQIDGTLCQDLAMIHTRCGQVESDPKIRHYTDAVNNLNVARNLWSALYQNTKDENYKNNIDAITKLIDSLGKKK